jgi:hypothetical protein
VLIIIGDDIFQWALQQGTNGLPHKASIQPDLSLVTTALVLLKVERWVLHLLNRTLLTFE